MKFMNKYLVIILFIVIFSTVALNNPTYGNSPQPTDVITRSELQNILDNYADNIEEQTVNMINKVVKSSVVIYSLNNKNDTIDWFGEDSDQGSGFFISNKYIITNYHVVSGPDKSLRIETNDNNIFHSAKIIYSDQTKDLSLLEIQDYSSDNFLTLGMQPKAGRIVYTVGSPVDFTFTVAKGVVSKENSYTMTQVDINVDHGSSGSPLIDNKGKLVGVIKSRAKNNSGIGFAIKVADIKQFAQYSAKYGGADIAQINEFLGLTSHL